MLAQASVPLGENFKRVIFQVGWCTIWTYVGWWAMESRNRNWTGVLSVLSGVLLTIACETECRSCMLTTGTYHTYLVLHGLWALAVALNLPPVRPDDLQLPFCHRCCLLHRALRCSNAYARIRLLHLLQAQPRHRGQGSQALHPRRPRPRTVNAWALGSWLNMVSIDRLVRPNRCASPKR